MKIVSVNVGVPREIKWQGKTVRTSIFKAPVSGGGSGGQRKVNAQWMMYCLTHNIGKIQRYGDIGGWKKEARAQIRR